MNLLCVYSARGICVNSTILDIPELKDIFCPTHNISNNP